MTSTTQSRRVKRETGALFQGRNLVIELGPYEVSIRPKGTRCAYRVSYAQIFRLGAENAVRQRRAEREAGRKERKPNQRTKPEPAHRTKQSARGNKRALNRTKQMLGRLIQ
jgi:hypothetical protein